MGSQVSTALFPLQQLPQLGITQLLLSCVKTLVLGPRFILVITVRVLSGGQQTLKYLLNE